MLWIRDFIKRFYFEIVIIIVMLPIYGFFHMIVDLRNYICCDARVRDSLDIIGLCWHVY